eukprot:686149_1
MGQSESATVTPQDVVGEVEEEASTLAPISVQYGPNIVGKLLGYDERTEKLAQAANQLYDAISRPSNENKRKAQILVNDVHSAGMDHGRQTVSLSEIEREMMDDIEYKAFLHKKTYGIRNKNDVDRKFNLSNMESVCKDFRLQIEQCLQNKEQLDSATNEEMPYYDRTFASLNCSKQMDLYNNCVTRKLSKLY